MPSNKINQDGINGYHYKGYIIIPRYSEPDSCWYSKVYGTEDLILCEGKTIDALCQDLRIWVAEIEKE